jgi:hypothetical protein
MSTESACATPALRIEGPPGLAGEDLRVSSAGLGGRADVVATLAIYLSAHERQRAAQCGLDVSRLAAGVGGHS